MDKILIIDDDESMRFTLGRYLEKSEYEILTAEDGENGIRMIQKYNPDLVISDLIMKEIGGLEVLRKAKEFDENLNVIMITAFDDMDSTIKAMQMGAYDYITKPIDKSRFNAVIKRALEGKKICDQLSIKISEQNDEFGSGKGLIGRTPKMKEIYKQIGQVSLNRVTVLIQGESGTGKELISKIIHYSGVTKNHPFIAINCSALTETLLESELFGHVKGAFTGAIREKKGKFELAGEGTIFLDEISETSPALQVKLLRVIQEKEFELVGGESTRKVKARIITSTNKKLSELVNKGLFREDLYYRLKVFNINVPPLRERKEDIPQLVVHFLEKINKELHKNITKVPFEVIEILQNYNWIGNVRELENILTQAAVLAHGNILDKDLILLKDERSENHSDNTPNMTLKEAEKIYIIRVLKHVNWNKAEALKILGIAKSTLYKKLKEYNIINPL